MQYKDKDFYPGDTTTSSQVQSSTQQTQNKPSEPSAKELGKKAVQDSSVSQQQKGGKTSKAPTWDPQEESSKGQRHHAGQVSPPRFESRGRSRHTIADQDQADREERERRIGEQDERARERKKILEQTPEDDPKDRFYDDELVEGGEF